MAEKLVLKVKFVLFYKAPKKFLMDKSRMKKRSAFQFITPTNKY